MYSSLFENLSYKQEKSIIIHIHINLLISTELDQIFLIWVWDTGREVYNKI